MLDCLLFEGNFLFSKLKYYEKAQEKTDYNNLIGEHMNIKTISFYIFKAIFLAISWFVLFAFDLDQANYDLFFISTFIYAGSIVFDLVTILMKANQASKLIKFARGLSIFLIVANAAVVIISLCISNWIDVEKIGNVYRFKITMESFITVFNVSPNLFSLKSFMIFVFISGIGSLFPSYFVDLADDLLEHKRKGSNERKE